MKKSLVLDVVKSSASSIFSKEDVLQLLESVDVSNGKVVTPKEIERAIEKVIDWVDNNERDLLDLGSAELEMNYDNRIEVVGVPIDTDALRSALENVFCDFAQEEELEVEVERTTLVEGAEWRNS